MDFVDLLFSDSGNSIHSIHVPGREGGTPPMSIHEYVYSGFGRYSSVKFSRHDHLQVALVEEDFKKAWDLKTVKSSHPRAPAQRSVRRRCIDRLIGIASQPELSGLLILSLCLVVRSRFFIAS